MPALLLVAGLAWAPAGADIPSPAELKVAVAPADPWQIEYEGVVVDVEVAPITGGEVLREGEPVRLRITTTDSATGTPLSGLYPAAWMDRMRPDEESNPQDCRDKVEEFVGGSILFQPELDFNVYYVLALNHDATVTVVDPLFGFGGTKLLAMINLPSPGEDWTLDPTETRLFVTAPEAGQLVVAETLGWERLALVDIGSRPGRLEMQSDGAYLWVAVDGGVVAYDPHGDRIVARIDTGDGPQELVLTDDDRRLFVANGGDGTVSVIDTARLEEVAQLETAARPVSMAYSDLASAVYVSHGSGSVVVVAADGDPRVVARVEAEPGLGEVRFAPDGRLAMVVNPREDVLHVIDASSHRLIQTGDMKSRPDQLAFSDELAYVRHAGSEIILMIPLDEIGEEGAPMPVIDFPGGQEPFGQGRRPSPAPAIVQAPGATAVLVANPGDQMIYYYKEGMAAPMGGFRNYDREPRAVLVVDRSLREKRRGGVYETAVQLPEPGRYQVAFFLDTPRIVHCFETEVTADPELERQRRAALPARVEPLFENPKAAAGEPLDLRFRLRDPNTGEPIHGAKDVQVLAYASGNWQHRLAASDLGDGVYGVSVVLPSPGSYTVAVECPSRRLGLHQSPQLRLEAVAAP